MSCSAMSIEGGNGVENAPFLACKLLSCFPFVCAHREDISHEHNPDAPRKRNPNVIADRLPCEQGADCVDDGGHRLVFRKGANDWRHRYGWHKR